jgi:hypothetical protein
LLLNFFHDNQFHQITDGGGYYCSKSYVQRWIYIMCQCICPLFGISLATGIHLPYEPSNCDEIEAVFNEIILRKSKISDQKALVTQVSSNKI